MAEQDHHGGSQKRKLDDISETDTSEIDTDSKLDQPLKKQCTESEEKYENMIAERKKKEQEEEHDLIFRPPKYAIAKIDFNRRSHEDDESWLIRNRRAIEIAFQAIGFERHQAERQYGVDFDF